jgi:Protein of unknown function (DUF2628)
VKTWTAHLHATKPPVLLKEGFAWGAYIFGPLWLLAQRAWVPAGLAIGGYVLVAVLTDDKVTVLLLLLANWCLGLWGNDLRRWALGMRGFTLAHVVAARDADSAFVRLLTARPDLADLYMPLGKA